MATERIREMPEIGDMTVQPAQPLVSTGEYDPQIVEGSVVEYVSQPVTSNDAHIKKIYLGAKSIPYLIRNYIELEKAVYSDRFRITSEIVEIEGKPFEKLVYELETEEAKMKMPYLVPLNDAYLDYVGAEPLDITADEKDAFLYMTSKDLTSLIGLHHKSAHGGREPIQFLREVYGLEDYEIRCLFPTIYHETAFSNHLVGAKSTVRIPNPEKQKRDRTAREAKTSRFGTAAGKCGRVGAGLVRALPIIATLVGTAAAWDYPTSPYYACDGEELDPKNPQDHNVIKLGYNGINSSILAVAEDPMATFDVIIKYPNGSTALEIEVDPTGGELREYPMIIPNAPIGTYDVVIKDVPPCDSFDAEWSEEPLPPVSELSTFLLLGTGLVFLSGYHHLRTRKKK